MKYHLFSKPILFATLGYPGSGKTYFSKRFAKEFHIFHLNSDRVRLEIFEKPKYSQAENIIVFRVMDFIAEELLKCGVGVIYDANSAKREYRRRFQHIANRQEARYILLWFQTPVELALKRLTSRGKLKSELAKRLHRPIGPEVLFWIRNIEEEPIKEPTIILDGKLRYSVQKKIVLKLLREK